MDVPRTLAEKVDYLIRTVHPRDRKPFTHPEIAAATQLSTGLLSALRSGKNVNPTKETVERLARFFGVPVAYFFDDQTTEQVAAQLGLAAAMRDVGIAHAATRLVGLSEGSLDAVAALTEQLRRLEGLNDPEAGAR
ncbi:helix-turn-helix domain-containing protein [Saccharothrix violaceirubra]|uniref:Transcriptional regulator with XRE-family HTH domain n=1 Tax=Saccharothrix violaceirubra TaxID=413306 RepID=A0A7W7WXH9_9PSEU|nr:helix-turn-helix domain-containing protein [Saccharothrix violaceirubra]MBB4967459.1 transcriptional regulator with XRE-family HTH domain [Saccharothrix violaceirubra]